MESLTLTCAPTAAATPVAILNVTGTAASGTASLSCPEGMYDMTEGYNNHWACGSECAGGSYTDGVCNCACQCSSGNPANLRDSAGPCLAAPIPPASPQRRADFGREVLPAKSVWVRLVGRNILELAEVEVYDASGRNVALASAGGVATQSSDYIASLYPASNAINGNYNDFSHTFQETGNNQHLACSPVA